MDQKLKFAVAVAVAVASLPAFAHIGYGGRDFGTVTTGTWTIANKNVTSNAGWANAADNSAVDTLVWGDTHKSAAFTFVLTGTSNVTFSVLANTAYNTGAGNTASLLPGFSIYQGKAAVAPFAPTQTALPSSADHDFSAASANWLLGTNPGNANLPFQAYAGVWNAKGDFKVGGDGDLPGDYSQLSSFSYKGSAFATGNATSASGSFLLGAGTYSVFVGGNDFSTYGNNNKFGFNATLSVAAVPEPESYAMMLAGLGLMGFVARRRKAS